MTTNHRRGLLAILAGYLLMASIYSIATPLFEASDELWHYPMVKYLADNGLQLPPQDPANPGPWRQEGSQPPLYYMVAAVLTSGIDTSDMEYIRRINPHADIGIVRPDGNANMVVHRTEAEAFPWRGTTLAVHIIRFFSIALGLGTVLVTYQLGREVFPEYPSYALGAAGLNAFLPMFLFISGSVNNDNLSNLLGNLLILLTVRLVKIDHEPGWKTYVVLGVTLGAGLLAKLNLVFFVPLVGLALFVISWRLRHWRPIVFGSIVVGALSIVIAGWWYWHNWQQYGDPTGINRFLEMVGRRAIPANAAQLWSERHSFTQAYWGFFGGVNVPLPEFVYLIFNIIGGIGLAGGAVFAIYTLVGKKWTAERWLPTGITILWPIVTFVSFLRWTAETPASQGRLVFGALSAISLWMAVGLVWWVPRRGHTLLLALSLLFVVFVACWSPMLISGFYATPELSQVDSTPVNIFLEPGRSDGIGEVDITASNSDISAVIEDFEVRPEEYAALSSRFEIVGKLEQDWSLFAHLVTEDGVIIAQRDVYPGQGKLATSDLDSGASWINYMAIPIPVTAYAPMKLSVMMGWYDLKSGLRMTLADHNETYSVGTIQLAPRPDPENLGVPNPIRINFDNKIELVGYELTDLSPAAGNTVDLTLYWRAKQKLDKDYKIFANILDTPSLTKYAASDGMPVKWQAPTTTWEPGVIVKDVHTLTVDPNAPPGMYDTEIGWYLQAEDGSLQRLRIITADGGMANDFMNLTRVRIVPAES